VVNTGAIYSFGEDTTLNSGLLILGENASLVGSITNSGTISGARFGLWNEGTITTLTNTGSIRGGVSSTGLVNSLAGDKFGIVNYVGKGVITTLNNLQGKADNTPLTYNYVLPVNYNIIVRSTNDYGQLSVANPSGSMVFGIYAGGVAGVSASTVTAGTYANVLQGLSGVLSGSTITTTGGLSITGATGNYGLLNYSLVLNSGNWDLVFTSTSTNIVAMGTHLTSDLGGILNPTFDGGTLKVASAGGVSQSFTVTSGNGNIDQNGVASNFSGNITDAGVGVSGKLTISNSATAGNGSVTLSGVNTYSGGTEVQAGANLTIGSSSAIGSGTLALVGTTTTTATLTTTATFTLANPITVAGDPNITVASGTTLTISSPITDGGSSGDLVVDGRGTLVLTAANTYTGLTSIANDFSTLELSGAGSISNSSSLSNRGTLNIVNKSGDVALGGSYTQSSTGNLSMRISPSGSQKLTVAGAAILSGGLTLSASSGTYSSGKYVLLTASGVTGVFGTLSSNLSNYTKLGYSLAYDSSGVYLVLTPNSVDTQQALVSTAAALQSKFTLQHLAVSNGFANDCTLFNLKNICISAGGRIASGASGLDQNNAGALLVAAFRPHSNYRVGMYLDQNLSSNASASTVDLGNGTPMIGIFGVWSDRQDGTGAEVKVSGGYGQKMATITRTAVDTSETGSGTSQLLSQGAQVLVKYGWSITSGVTLFPYIGIRYIRNQIDGYTEQASPMVTTPLTFSAVSVNTTTVLAGAGLSYAFGPKVIAFAGLGMEKDTDIESGSYAATGLSGLNAINFGADPVRTRPTATLGSHFMMDANQRVTLNAKYRQDPYGAAPITTLMAMYTVGL
jgi:autotransporter-associated beta strand protein